MTRENRSFPAYNFAESGQDALYLLGNYLGMGINRQTRLPPQNLMHFFSETAWEFTIEIKAGYTSLETVSVRDYRRISDASALSF